MANRVLRDWTESYKVHKLSAEAERFFTRLIMKADDFGRYLGHVKLLKATLFPLHEGFTDGQVSGWVSECVAADLILLYEVEEKAYIEIKGFDQKGLKVRRPKYPPSSEADRYELITGYVYIIGTTEDRPVKVGFSMNPWSRLKEINANHPEELKIISTFKAEKRTESLLHIQLKNKRVKNEWFQLSPLDFQSFKAIEGGQITTDKLFELLRSNYEQQVLTTLLEKKRNETEVETEEETETEDIVCELKQLDAEVVSLAADFTEGICKYFSVKPIVLSPRYNKVCDFVSMVANQNKLQEVVNIFEAYKTYKDRSKEAVHGVETWIGTKQNHYEDGHWTMTDWIEKEKNYKHNGTGTGIKGTLGQTSPEPGKQYDRQGF